jgi:hypothetical protein
MKLPPLPGSRHLAFRINDAWWSRIKPTLPPRCIYPPSDRLYLERLFAGISALPVNPRGVKEQWREAEAHARALAALLEKIQDNDRLEWVSGMLEQLADLAHACAAEAELLMLPTVTKKGPTVRVQATRRPRNELIYILYIRVLDFWTDHDGLLKVSRNVIDGKQQPTGAVVDFLRAILSGWPDAKVSGEGLADIVKRYKLYKQRKR